MSNIIHKLHLSDLSMNVELRHLRYFLAVAEELHFGRAAERARIAQPALSQQIRRLEAALGTELFRRTTRRVRLTAAGEALIPHARRALQEVADGRVAAVRAARGEVGRLSVGFVETAAGTIVPAAVQRFRAERPAVELSLRELGVAEQVEGLRSGRIDVGVVRAPVDAPELQLEPIAEEGLLAAMPSGHQLASRRRIAPGRLAGEPLVALSREIVPGLHDQLADTLGGGLGGVRITQEATSIQAVLGLVAAGLGIAVLPASVRSQRRDGVSFVSLVPSPRSTVLVASRRDHGSPLIGAFIDAARAGAPS